MKTIHNIGALIDISAWTDDVIDDFADDYGVENIREFRTRVLAQLGGRTAITVFARVFRDGDETMIEVAPHDRFLATMMRTADTMFAEGAA